MSWLLSPFPQSEPPKIVQAQPGAVSPLFPFLPSSPRMDPSLFLEDVLISAWLMCPKHPKLMLIWGLSGFSPVLP